METRISWEFYFVKRRYRLTSDLEGWDFWKSFAINETTYLTGDGTIAEKDVTECLYNNCVGKGFVDDKEKCLNSLNDYDLTFYYYPIYYSSFHQRNIKDYFFRKNKWTLWVMVRMEAIVHHTLNKYELYCLTGTSGRRTCALVHYSLVVVECFDLFVGCCVACNRVSCPT